MKNKFDEKWNIELFRKAAEIIGGLDIFPPFTGGVSEKDIEKEESALKLPIRGSFREFLLRFGAQQDEGFEGIDLKFGGRISERTPDFWEDGLPNSHIVVFFEGSTCYSMDTSKPTFKDEYAIFEFDFDEPKESLQRVADSFCEFFIKYFENEKGIKKLIAK